MQSTVTSGAFILVRKGKGHGDGEERFERHHRHEAYGLSRHRRHSHGMRGFNGNQGFAITQASEAATKTSPMAKTDPSFLMATQRTIFEPG